MEPSQIIKDQSTLSYLQIYGTKIQVDSQLKGYKSGKVLFPTLNLGYDLLPIQFIKFHPIQSKSPENQIREFVGQIDDKLGCLKLDVYPFDVGDNLGNILIRARGEACALIAVGRLTELRDYFSGTISHQFLFDEASVHKWDYLMVSGLLPIAFEKIHSLPRDRALQERVNLYRQTLQRKFEEINTNKKEPISLTAMLAAALKKGYPKKEIGRRIRSEPFNIV